MSKLKIYLNDKNELMGHTFYCPGCEQTHYLKADTWTVKNVKRPSVTPSYHLVGKCHCFIKDGVIEYLDDCNHRLAGFNINMVPVCFWPNGKRLELVEGIMKTRKATITEAIVDSFKNKVLDFLIRPKKRVTYFDYKKWEKHKKKWKKREEENSWKQDWGQQDSDEYNW